MSLNLISETKSFGGKLSFYSHPSSTCKSEMRFSIYQPPQATSQTVPILYFLSGLTCTEENFMAKAGAQKYAAEYGLMLVAPDTSPRNTGISGEDDDWDFGTGAGFYVDATEKPWASHYQMYSYVVEELPAIITANFPVQSNKQGIFGHSMGGHGALVCAMRNPNLYQSVSAFAPIVAPTQCPWGQKVFTGYLGENKENWRDYDATESVKKVKFHTEILIDQGTADKYLAEQLMPELFEQTCTQINQPLTLRYQQGYDHSYYFISSFIEDHIRHHAILLGVGSR
ncbi:MAG: S-formylglutathione hydrolase [Cyanomargarita calcarea GSE-NOS-MK-12-04C]|jgi:S-formylglutathione hydrolase|uniref:S-formylglutathione hydrolase n=1 Tax=Cyanomargarita calcarea GSE-NOS-MK-12-04C TaxID=2839659 RepID=A0A951QP25_9CYAN|nr:S-formylglutathione hydrolase [Cyanomargarita calcarea GSE-NOS-MK-12-04C]